MSSHWRSDVEASCLISTDNSLAQPLVPPVLLGPTLTALLPTLRNCNLLEEPVAHRVCKTLAYGLPANQTKYRE
jgi:hypothetical protein